MSLPPHFVRRVTGIALVGWLALLVGLLIQRQLSVQRTPFEHQGGDDGLGGGGQRPIRLQKGVVYQSTIGAEPSFRIAADEAAEFENGWAQLSNVQISLYSQGEVAYGLTATNARFSAVLREAETEGESILSLQGGIALRSPGFTVKGNDRLLLSRGAVSFAGPGWGGVADAAKVYLADNVLELTGNVTVSQRGRAGAAEPAVVILAPSLLYQRKQAAVMLGEGCTVLYGTLRVAAPRVAVLLTGVEGQVRKIIMAPPVHIDGQLQNAGAVQIEAGDTVLDVLEEGRMRITAAALAGPGWLTIRLASPDTGLREVRTWWLVGEGTGQAWEWLEGQGQVCAVEIPPDAEPRNAEAKRARIDFSGGQPTLLAATSHVLLSMGRQRAEGGELTYSLSSSVFTLKPEGTGRVRLEAPELEAFCNRLESAPDGTLRGQGDVTGTVRQRTPLTQEGAPVSFAADNAVVPAGSERLVLDGNARLWQRDRVVRADTIELERATEVLIGKGNVITSARTDAASGAGEVVVKARQVRYDRNASEAVYEGDAMVTDPQGTATCQKLVVTQDADGSVKLLDLEGGVTIKQPASGRALTGEKARFVMAEDLFEMWGKPVLVQEAGGNQIKADHLVWRRRHNTIVVLGREDAPSETLYHLDAAKSPTSPPHQKAKGSAPGTPTPMRPQGR